MKKFIVIVGLLIIVAALAIPYASGLVMEKTIRRAVSDANALYAATGTGYTLTVVRYDRRLFTSDIALKMDLGILKQIYPVDAIFFKDHARHGYTGVVSTTTLQQNPWYADFVAQSLQGRDPVHITTRYGFSGSIESTVDLDAFSVAVEGETIDVGTGRMVMKTDRQMKYFSSSGKWAGLSAAGKMVVGEIAMDSDLTIYSPYLWAGDVRYAIAKFGIYEKNDRVELNDLNGDYTLSVSDDQSKASVATRFSVGSVVAKETTLDSMSVRMAVNGVDAAGYAEFVKMYADNMGQVLGSMAGLENEPTEAREALKQQMAMIGFQMMAAYEKMLKKGLEFTISDLDVRLADGQISGGLTLRLLKDMTFMQFAPVSQQPDLIFDMLYMKSDLRLPVKLVGEHPRLLQPAFPGMQTGLFVKQGDALLHSAETSDGKLMLNHHEVILPGQRGD